MRNIKIPADILLEQLLIELKEDKIKNITDLTVMSGVIKKRDERINELLLEIGKRNDQIADLKARVKKNKVLKAQIAELEKQVEEGKKPLQARIKELEAKLKKINDFVVL